MLGGGVDKGLLLFGGQDLDGALRSVPILGLERPILGGLCPLLVLRQRLLILGVPVRVGLQLVHHLRVLREGQLRLLGLFPHVTHFLLAGAVLLL